MSDAARIRLIVAGIVLMGSSLLPIMPLAGTDVGGRYWSLLVRVQITGLLTLSAIMGISGAYFITKGFAGRSIDERDLRWLAMAGLLLLTSCALIFHWFYLVPTAVGLLILPAFHFGMAMLIKAGMVALGGLRRLK